MEIRPGLTFSYIGVKWRVSAIYDNNNGSWAWIVNVDKPADQRRLSTKAIKEVLK